MREVNEAEIRRIAAITHRVVGMLADEQLKPEQCADVLCLALGHVIHRSFDDAKDRDDAVEWCKIALDNAVESAGDAYSEGLVIDRTGGKS